MFPLRRSNKTSAEVWPDVLALVEDDDRRAAVQQVAPQQRRESFLQALRRIEPQQAIETLAAGRRWHSADRLVDRPTVAVSGMLNSGKTSLVSTFLSPAGQRRTLRGTGNLEGTHRFVLWMPESWRDDVTLWSLLMSRISDCLGQAPESLADDPETASRQYNNRDGDASRLSIPLLATDPALDEAGLGLLDCPDIVSDAEFGLGTPEDRRRLLGRAARLCSAFVIVSSAESSRDTTLAELLRIASDLMPGVPRLLAVNKIRPQQTPDSVAETFEPLVKRFNIASLYAAYDFDVPASKPFIPRQDIANDAVETDASRPHDSSNELLPVFFSVAKNPDENPPAAINNDRFLSAVPQQLDRAQLLSQLHQALRLNLETALWQDGVEKITRDAEQSFEKTKRCHRILIDAAMEFFGHRDASGRVVDLRLHQSERILRQLSESFAATAPWYARWGVRLNTTLRRFVGGAGDFIRNLTPTAITRQAADDIKGRFQSGEYGGLISPDAMVRELTRYGGGLLMEHFLSETDTQVPLNDSATDSPLLAPVQSAVIRFEENDFTTLDPRRLDAAVRQMWSEVPLPKRIAAGLTPLAALLATFGAVLMVPIDLGTNLFLAASIPELLAAAGLTTLSAMWAANKSSRDVGQQAARQQLADFLAVLCDELGLARPESATSIVVGKSKVALPPPRIEPCHRDGPTIAVYRVRTEFTEELDRLMPRS
ncbi:MAG: hypothetical protein AAF539_02560 [Planctomycetota bacterium]